MVMERIGLSLLSLLAVLALASRGSGSNFYLPSRCAGKPFCDHLDEALEPRLGKAPAALPLDSWLAWRSIGDGQHPPGRAGFVVRQPSLRQLRREAGQRVALARISFEAGAGVLRSAALPPGVGGSCVPGVGGSCVCGFEAQ